LDEILVSYKLRGVSSKLSELNTIILKTRESEQHVKEKKENVLNMKRIPMIVKAI